MVSANKWALYTFFRSNRFVFLFQKTKKTKKQKNPFSSVTEAAAFGVPADLQRHELEMNGYRKMGEARGQNSVWESIRLFYVLCSGPWRELRGAFSFAKESYFHALFLIFLFFPFSMCSFFLFFFKEGNFLKRISWIEVALYFITRFLNFKYAIYYDY